MRAAFWVDTHLQAGTIDVLNQIVQYGRETRRATSKTDSSAATVALDTDTIAVHQTHQRANRGNNGEGVVETGLVLPNPTAAHYTPPTSPTTSST